MNRYTKQLIQEGITQSPLSMRGAAKALGIPYQTFIAYAKKYELYAPNPSGKGTSKNAESNLDRLLSTISGESTAKVSSSSLKKRLFKHGLKQNVCEECGQLPTWNGKPLVLHLDHINGDHYDNRLENLQILCPHCHTQTATYSRQSGEIKHRVITECSIDEIKEACSQAYSITEAAVLLGVNSASDSVRVQLKLYELKPRPVKAVIKGDPVVTGQRKQRPQFVPAFTEEELQELLRRYPLTEIGKMFSLTGNAIGRWVKKWKLIQPPIGYFYRSGVREKTELGYNTLIPFDLS